MAKLSFMFFVSSLFFVGVVLSVAFIVGTSLMFYFNSSQSFVYRKHTTKITHFTLNTHTQHTITARIKETPISLPYSVSSCPEQVRPQARNKQNNTTLPSSTFHQQRRLLLLMRNTFPVTCAQHLRCLDSLYIAWRRGRGVEVEYRCGCIISNCIYREANTRFSGGKQMMPNCNAITLPYLCLVSLSSKETYGIPTHFRVANFHHTGPHDSFIVDILNILQCK
jgi:hypothetical protein